MPTCDSKFVQPKDETAPRVVCPGGHWKFDSCRDEALYLWAMEDALDMTGDTDFEGHLAVVIVNFEDVYGLGTTDEPDEREVIIEPGSYLVWTASSGAVTVQVCDTAEEAHEIFEQVDRRYALWDAGCNPNDPAGHADCEDTCKHPEWADAS